MDLVIIVVAFGSKNCINTLCHSMEHSLYVLIVLGLNLKCLGDCLVCVGAFCF